METLTQLVLKNIANDPYNPTRTYTDSWLGYNALRSNGYDHRRGNHSIRFGSGSEHSNTIESYWRLIRKESGFNNGFSAGKIEKLEWRLHKATWRLSTTKTDLVDSLAEMLMAMEINFDEE